MAIAAVPAYLAGKDFKDASPGLRFGMYLPLWNDAFELLKDQKTEALKKATTLTPEHKKTMATLAQRQALAAQTMLHVLTLDAVATAPFTTGLGNEHPLENGFAFLNPYGLPYLPGSGIKGVLRQAARELASGEWGDAHGWVKGEIHSLERKGEKSISLTMLDVLFGRETQDGDKDLVRGALSFWDAIPQIHGNSLAVDIMTPHQSHYYQQKQDRKSGDSVSPHDSGQPTPIPFLTLPPKTQFTFHVVCDIQHLERLAPNLAHGQRWQALLTAAFEHAFAWLGFGAKTAVGYGAMESDAQRRSRDEEVAQQQQRAKEQEEIEAAQRRQTNAIAWEGARPKFNRANGSLTVEKSGQTAIALAPEGEALLQTLPADIQQKIKTNQFVRITAYVAEGVLVRVEKA